MERLIGTSAGKENASELVNVKSFINTTTVPTTAKSARRNGLYLSNKELTAFNLGRNKFGAQLSLSDIVNNADGSKGGIIKIHEDGKPLVQGYSNVLLEQDEDDEEMDQELTSTMSNNSASTINKRSSIPYVNNRFSSTSSQNGSSSVRNSKRFSLMSTSSSDSDMDDAEDEDFNRCFFNDPNGRMRNLTTISINSNSSGESIGFGGSHGGKPGLVGYEPPAPAPPLKKKSVKKVRPKQQYQQQPQLGAKNNVKRFSQISSSSEKRYSIISGSSDNNKNARFSQISSTSSDRSSKRLSVMGLLRHPQQQSQQQQQQQLPQKPAPFLTTNNIHQRPKPQQQQPQQSISQPSSSKIHRLMHSVSIRSGLFKLKDPSQPEEKKVQMKRSFFSIRSGLNRSASSMDIGSVHFDRNSISLPVPQDQTLKKIDNKLKNSPSVYSMASKR